MFAHAEALVHHRVQIIYTHTVAEYDPERPWLVVGPLRRLTVDLSDAEDFLAWAAQAWPRPRYEAVLLPELPPWQSGG